jgi:hypothetical protein
MLFPDLDRLIELSNNHHFQSVLFVIIQIDKNDNVILRKWRDNDSYQKYGLSFESLHVLTNAYMCH